MTLQFHDDEEFSKFELASFEMSVFVQNFSSYMNCFAGKDSLGDGTVAPRGVYNLSLRSQCGVQPPIRRTDGQRN